MVVKLSDSECHTCRGNTDSNGYKKIHEVVCCSRGKRSLNNNILDRSSSCVYTSSVFTLKQNANQRGNIYKCDTFATQKHQERFGVWSVPGISM